MLARLQQDTTGFSMFIHRRHAWQIPDRLVTPEAAVLGRRGVLAGGVGVLALGGARPAQAATDGKYPAGRAVTPEPDATTYNNYYEFGEDKSIYRAAQRFPISPWTVELAGLVAQPRTLDLADLLKQVQLEDRTYRHRCVEGWGMTVPWTGFPLAALVKLAEPSAAAYYVVFESAANPRTMPGVRNSLYPWPYIEGCTMQEAQNDLAFMVTGMYGHDLPKQDGAPLRVHFPWKYGFKSGKAIVKISFVATQPETMWHAIQPSEYGFWANVNPAVPHPRWSQATERLIGSGERVPTMMWNGYGEWVAGMYADKQNERLYA